MTTYSENLYGAMYAWIRKYKPSYGDYIVEPPPNACPETLAAYTTLNTRYNQFEGWINHERGWKFQLMRSYKYPHLRFNTEEIPF